jgi:hypothetical protein
MLLIHDHDTGVPLYFIRTFLTGTITGRPSGIFAGK